MTDETPFHKGLRWRIHDPDEAMALAASHHQKAAEMRSNIPDPIPDFRTECQAAGLEHKAHCHDELAKACERHAETLIAERPGPWPISPVR